MEEKDIVNIYGKLNKENINFIKHKESILHSVFDEYAPEIGNNPYKSFDFFIRVLGESNPNMKNVMEQSLVCYKDIIIRTFGDANLEFSGNINYYPILKELPAVFQNIKYNRRPTLSNDSPTDYVVTQNMSITGRISAIIDNADLLGYATMLLINYFSRSNIAIFPIGYYKKYSIGHMMGLLCYFDNVDDKYSLRIYNSGIGIRHHRTFDNKKININRNKTMRTSKEFVKLIAQLLIFSMLNIEVGEKENVNIVDIFYDKLINNIFEDNPQNNDDKEYIYDYPQISRSCSYYGIYHFVKGFALN